MEIIKIGSITCTSCLVMDKIFNSIKSDYSFTYKELDYDFDEDKVKKYNPGKILPIYIILKDNIELGRIIGEKKEKEFKDELDKIIVGD